MMLMHGNIVAEMIGKELGGTWTLQPLGASAFCGTWLALQGGRRLFIKSSARQDDEALRAEADGLQALARTGAVRVPEVAAIAQADDGSVLALEWLDLQPANEGFGKRLGQAVGRLHAQSGPLTPSRNGWRPDNFIGATPQSNTPTPADTLADWLWFWREQRLGALRARLAGRVPEALRHAMDEVMRRVPRFFEDGYIPRPRLIHGDLWAGNWGMLADGTPVIYDPAVSCSDAEAELAMMELFGGIPAGFWPAYRGAAGLHTGYAARRPLYQLYHLLNHALLFGGGYTQQALRCAQSLITRRPAGG